MTTDTLTLADFLLARIAEDESVARAAAGSRWNSKMYRSVWTDTNDNPRYVRLLSYGGRHAHWEQLAPDALGEATCKHVARFDPARVLAECAAKRRIVELHDYGYVSRAPGSPVEPVCDVCAESGTWDQWPCLTLKLLALPYADHPDYRQEWRP